MRKIIQKQRAGIRHLTVEDLRDKGIDYHRNHLRRLWMAGKFPKPIKHSPRKLVWPEYLIDQWLAEKERGVA
jgi:hypothetical protein